MKNFWHRRVLDEVKDGNQGGSGYAPEPQGKQDPAAVAATSQTQGDQFDDFGYRIEPAKTPGAEKPEGDAGTKVEPPKEEKIENPATGYGDEPPVVPADPPPAEKKPEPVKDELELNVEGVPEAEAAKVREFAKKHGVTKEVAQAMIDERREAVKQVEAQRAEYEKAMQKRIAETRKQWHDELKNDSQFGGDKFNFHVKRAEKVLEEFMPSTKKVLTERKTMLPPYVMRDLAKLADHLYATEKLVQGEASKPDADEKENDDPLNFYR